MTARPPPAPAPPPVREPWKLDAAGVAAALGVDPRAGLTAGEAAARRRVHGPNALAERDRAPWWHLLVRQLTNTMTALLGAAALITALIGEVQDTVVIAVIVVLNAGIGYFQEHRAEAAMAALKRLTAESAVVVRDAAVTTVPASELVPGDVVQLAAGSVVPADLRLVDAERLQAGEASLTGESAPVDKTVAPLPDVSAALVADQRSMAFKGTYVTAGRGTGIVVATGMATELGRIATLLQAPGSGATPLQRRLATLGRWLAGAAVAVCAAVFVAGVSAGEPTDEMFLTAVSLAVAAIPEGLPAVVTVALALGARRMADRRALVRRLPAVETLGSVTVICTDKTGTLTESRMVVERVWTPAGEHAVTGQGYAPAGRFEPAAAPEAHAALTALAEVAAACNDARLRPPAEPGAGWEMTGDPTEGALLALAAKGGVDAAALAAERPRLAEVPFDAGRRRMTTVHGRGDGAWVATKGALSALAPLLRPGDPALAEAEAVGERWAAEGFRVLALAERTLDRVPGAPDDAETGLALAGIVGIADPPRPDVAAAVAAAQAAGIVPVMITGDHPATATAIAQRLGMLAPGDEVLTGDALAGLDDGALAALAPRVRVYARTNPEQKLRIVDAWRSRGAVVAMTGDGVNDAPALRRADIGVAMGITGTDVSKEAADMVLADDHFATIVGAVEEGRRIYDNIRRFVRYLLTTNSGEVWVMFLAPLLGLPLPLLPVQILWINLVTDGLPAIALGLEPAAPDTMRRPPRRPADSILAGGLWQHALLVGLLMAAVTIPVQALAREAGWPWRTMVFTTLALLQLGHALAVRSEHDSVLRLGVRSNPWLAGAVGVSFAVQLALVYVPALQGPFSTEALGVAELAVVLAASTAALLAVEAEKLVRRRRAGRSRPLSAAGR